VDLSLILSRNALFWILQLFGWGGLFIISSLTLTLFYNQAEFIFIAHNLVRSILGAIMTLPLRTVYTRVWRYSAGKRLTVVFGFTLLISIVWTLVIIELHELMTGQFIALFDYGGWIYSSIFIFMSWAASYHGIKYFLLLQEEHKTLLKAQSEKRHQLLRRSEAENRAKLAKLKFLSYQLNPHFLFNTLNSIYSMVETSKKKDAKKMISQLSQYLRASLSQQEDILISLERELEILEMYLDIEKTRFGDHLQIEYNCSEESMKHKLPIFLLQPLVENSIKHAISRAVDGGIIRITCSIKNELLIITVEDSGSCKINLVTPQSENIGLGLANTRERLLVIYQDRASFDLTDSDLGGVKVVIKLPINNEDLLND